MDKLNCLPSSVLVLYAGDDYDEVHIAESSSSEPSPRDQELQSTNTSLPVYTGTSSRYSRHEYAPTNRATAQSTSRGVDEGNIILLIICTII